MAIPGALTADALTKRPEDVTDAYLSQLYRRILPAGSSQVSALLAQKPKSVIVELGATYRAAKESANASWETELRHEAWIQG
jgi:hypothetical protein